MRYVRGQIQNNRILFPVGIRRFVEDPTTTPDLNFHQFTALLDTGASRTAISQNVIQKCGLIPFGQMPVGNVKRTEMHSTFMFYVGVWPDSDDGSPSVTYGIGDEVLGIDGGDSRFYDVLLGMDIITQGCLTINFGNEFEFALQ